MNGVNKVKDLRAIDLRKFRNIPIASAVSAVRLRLYPCPC